MKLNLLIACLLAVSLVDWLLLIKETVRNDINRLKAGLPSYGRSTYVLLGISMVVITIVSLLAIFLIPKVTLNTWVAILASFFGYLVIRIIEALVTVLAKEAMIKHGKRVLKVGNPEQ